MELTFTIAWWHVPAIVTLLALGWAFCWPAREGHQGGGIGAGISDLLTALFRLGVAFLVIAIAWAIAGALK